MTKAMFLVALCVAGGADLGSRPIVQASIDKIKPGELIIDHPTLVPSILVKRHLTTALGCKAKRRLSRSLPGSSC